MVVQHNLPAMNSHRQLGVNNAHTSKTLEKLSSGCRVNRAGDDAAGLAISEKMRGQIRGLDMATTNAENGVSLIQTAEGGLNETHAILQRMRELSVQSANGTYADDVDRQNINKEVTALKDEVDRIASSTHYNGIKLLDGSVGGAKGTAANLTDVSEFSFAAPLADELEGKEATVSNSVIDGVTFTTVQVGDKTYSTSAGDSVSLFDGNGNSVGTVTTQGTVANAVLTGVILDAADTAPTTVSATSMYADDASKLTFQIGANGSADQQVKLHVGSMASGAIGSDKGNVAGISVATREDANTAINVLDSAINQVSGTRADLGALQNRLEHTINNLGTTRENLQAAESSIRDVDMAKEMMEFTKNNILSQASQSMLSQANQLPQGVLQLLK